MENQLLGSCLSERLAIGQIPPCSCKIFHTKEIILNSATPNTHPLESLREQWKGNCWQICEDFWDCPSVSGDTVMSFQTHKSRRNTSPVDLRWKNCWKSFAEKEMILSENLDSHEGMKSNRNGNAMGKYKHILLIIQNSLTDNQLLKEKVKTMYCGVYGINTWQ